MKLRRNGFSLIELMIVVALLGILIAIAAPSFRTLMIKRSVAAAADGLVMDLKFARSEAVRRTTTVSMCSSSNGTSCITSTASWRDGWIVWVDDIPGGTVGTLDVGEEIVRVQGPWSSIASISSGVASNDFLKITFLPLGLASPSPPVNQTFFVSPVDASSFTDGSKRVVCVSLQGRAALRSVGATTC